MKLWSKGLGRTEVSMDFRYYKVVRDRESGQVTILGNMRDPVNWEFRILLEPADIAGFMKVFFHPSMLWFTLKNFFHFFIYLFTRRKYSQEVDLEQKVLTAYDNMVNRAPRKRRPKLDAAETDEKKIKTNAA